METGGEGFIYGHGLKALGTNRIHSETKFFFFPSLNCFRNNSLELRWALTEACGLFMAGFELSLVAEGGLLSSCGRWASLVVEQGL